MKCSTCGKMNCMAHGGDVRERPSSSEGQKGWVHDKDYNRGVHRETGGGESYAGTVARKGSIERSKEMHQDKLAESRSMPNPKLKGLAHGGVAGKDGTDMYEMDPDVPSMHGMDDGGEVDSELDNMLADECFEAFEKKDKQGFIDALKAIIANSGGDM